MGWLRAADRYGRQLNQFDVLKLLALATMIVDHVGFYLEPENLYLRAIGRMAFPLFLFLVGYSRTWRLNSDLVFWAVLLTLFTACIRQPLLPLDILITILLVRGGMKALMPRLLLSPFSLAILYFLMLIAFPLFIWCDYSSIAMLFAVAGYLQRERPDTWLARLFLLVVMVTHAVIESLVFGFPPLPWLCMASVLLADYLLLARFNALKPVNGSGLPAPIKTCLLWCARNSLPLYGLHLMLLMWLAKAR